VGVQFEIDASGILHVLARDTRTGREKIVELKSAVNVDDAAVQKMVEASVEHAFDDLAARRWVEARLKATETLTATRKAITDFGPEMEPENRRQIESAAAAVEAILGAGSQDGGNLQALQAAVAALDEATRPLADLLMDRALEAVLRRRGVIQK
jgi:molecular chaperone DnaK (HSP70)